MVISAVTLRSPLSSALSLPGNMVWAFETAALNTANILGTPWGLLCTFLKMGGAAGACCHWQAGVKARGNKIYGLRIKRFTQKLRRDSARMQGVSSGEYRAYSPLEATQQPGRRTSKIGIKLRNTPPKK
jgi:hypothetical protein